MIWVDPCLIKLRSVAFCALLSSSAVCKISFYKFLCRESCILPIVGSIARFLFASFYAVSCILPIAGSKIQGGADDFGRRANTPCCFSSYVGLTFDRTCLCWNNCLRQWTCWLLLGKRSLMWFRRRIYHEILLCNIEEKIEVFVSFARREFSSKPVFDWCSYKNTGSVFFNSNQIALFCAYQSVHIKTRFFHDRAPPHYLGSWASKGGRGGRSLALPWILKFAIFLLQFLQKAVFLLSREKIKFHHHFWLLAPPGKIFLATYVKIHCWALYKKPLDGYAWALWTPENASSKPFGVGLGWPAAKGGIRGQFPTNFVVPKKFVSNIW